MNTETILFLLIALIISGFLFSQMLEYINLKNQKTILPDSLRDWYSDEQYGKSRSYQKAHWKFGFFSGLVHTILTLTLILTGFYGWLDTYMSSFTEHSIWISISFFVITGALSYLIQLPFDWYEYFIIEESFGFNKMSRATFISDRVKGLILGAVIGLPLIWIFLVLVDKIGADFWIWFGLVATAFILFMNLFYTSLLLPLFNKLTPLPEGALKTALLDYAEKVNFPVKNILVMDGSKRSSKANAFFSGMGKSKKIVLFDTLIEKHSTGELVAILAHEVGHYKKRHIILGLFSSIIQIFFVLWILSQFIGMKELSFALGGSRHAIHLNLLSFGILFSPVSGLAGMLSMMISRLHEFQADAYAKATSDAKDLISGLKKLSVDNLSNLTPHPLYVFFHYSHPPVLQRIKRLLN